VGSVKHFLRGAARGESGSSIVEMAVTLPILLAFVFGLMQVCFAYYTYETISESAREGTRYAIVRGSTCQTSAKVSCTASASSIQSYVMALGWPNVAGGTITAVASFPDGDEVPGHRVLVKVNCAFPYKIPFVSTEAFSMSSSSEMYIVQ